MKSIKERADEFIGHPQEIGEDLSFAMARNAYIQGAKEQRKIDMQKTLEYLEIALQCGVHSCNKDRFIMEYKQFMENKL